MLISVCVATVRAGTIGSTVEAVKRQTWPDWELVLVPQGNDERLHQACRSYASNDPRLKVVALEGKGLSRARNAGVRACRGTVVAFTDDDCEPREDWLSVLAAEFSASPGVGLVGGAVVAPSTRRLRLETCPALAPREALYEPGRQGRNPPAGFDWIGANFALRASTLSNIGRFDECLGAGSSFPSAEDTDYKLRLEAAGVPMLSTPRSVVFHTHGIRAGLRNRVSFTRNYASGSGALAAKLTLAGDARGREWAVMARKACISALSSGRVDRLPPALERYRSFMRAYRACMRDFAFESCSHTLVPRGPN